MKKMLSSVLTTALLLTAAVPAFAQDSNQAAAPATASVVNPESISVQSYFFAAVSWRNVPGASHYEFYVYKNNTDLVEYGTQSVTGRDIGLRAGDIYRIDIRAVGPNNSTLASGTTGTFIAGSSSIYISL
ncbi:hypothetical protein [Paenibacillus oleatilyticus]|uniref:Fibronectin type-III domain-containing protein n=1 Tax=Paenibacillus oleatilyticus TaxID=2594886 RepID=A0ABV4UXP6_9BACL